MAWKIFVTARTIREVGKGAVELLRGAGCELIIPEKLGPLKADDLRPQLKGMDAALISPDQFNAEVLGSPEAAQLKIISRWGVGYDSIDVPAATKQGIVVAYTPGLLNDTVADYTFALLFAIARRVHEADAAMHRGEWKLLWGNDIFGKTLGIIGCGRIGQAVARRGTGFNFRLLGHDVFASPDAEKLGIKFVGLDELLEQSDFVSLHCALTPENRGLIGEAQLRKMKRTAYLINTARGALVNEPALERALKENWIAGAALDTFAAEPMAVDHPFRTTPNLLLSPHQAPCGRETGERVSLTAAQAIVDLMNGQRPQLVIDPSVFDAPNLRAKLK
jgi:phosphoglycerate dehydrogenase-like enzyme